MGKHRQNINDLLKIFLIIPVILLDNAFFFIDGNELDVTVADLLANAIFDFAQIGDEKAYVLVIERMYFIFIFNMIYGTYIYKDFLISSIYLFTRIKNRNKWFLRKSIELLKITILYTILFLTILLAICNYTSKYSIDGKTIQMLFVLFIFITLFLFATTLCINLLAIKYNSSVGFVWLYIVLLICIAVLLTSDWTNLVIDAPYMLLLNPVAGIILCLSGNNHMRLIGASYYLIFNFIILLIGTVYIKRLEIGFLGKENDG